MNSFLLKSLVLQMKKRSIFNEIIQSKDKDIGSFLDYFLIKLGKHIYHFNINSDLKMEKYCYSNVSLFFNSSTL